MFQCQFTRWIVVWFLHCKNINQREQKREILCIIFQVYRVIPDTPTTRAVATFIQSLAPLNSAANPLIYCLFSTNIGQAICNIFGCRQGPNSRPTLSTGLTTSTATNSSKALVGQTASNATLGGMGGRPSQYGRHAGLGLHQEELRQPLCSKTSAAGRSMIKIIPESQ